MGAIVEVTATEPTRAVLQEPGPLKHVRFVSKPSAHETGEAVRRVVIARLSDFEERPEELWRLTIRGVIFAAPLVLMALGKKPPSVNALQLLAVLASRFGTAKGDPFVAPTVGAVRRILKAHALGAEKQLIASAAIDDGSLSVWSCEPKLYRCSVSEIPALAALDPKALGKLEISESGSRIHWATADIDLDMDAVREFADPKARKEAESKYRADAVRYGAAIRALRLAHGLRQGKIPGLSEREVRRLENGEVLPHSDTLKSLADAHGWSVAEYMAKLAAESKAPLKRRQR